MTRSRSRSLPGGTVHATDLRVETGPWALTHHHHRMVRVETRDQARLHPGSGSRSVETTEARRRRYLRPAARTAGGGSGRPGSG